MTATNPQHDIPATIPLLAIVGPTASGKTGLALALAARLRSGEYPVHGATVVSADSRQIYRSMDIATAKATPGEQAQLPHALLDVVWPNESFTLAEYQEAANAAIASVWQRGKLPMLVGGTGLYVRAVVDGLTIPAVPPNADLRAELEALASAQGSGALYEKLVALDPVAAARMDSGNVRRLVRALEVCLVTGRPFSELQGRRATPYRPLLLGLNMERAALYARADARIDAMIAAGLVEETRALVERGYSWSLPAMSSLGYRQMGSYLRGEVSLDEAVEHFKLATHKYIRRQLTWFRSDTRISWLDAALPPAQLADQAERHVTAWLNGG
ncbi:MAG TPA: tRNA (adenosine(37)-N6)-dimethylallyltransferase MiaA [Ktedonobacterales bacterium]